MFHSPAHTAKESKYPLRSCNGRGHAVLLHCRNAYHPSQVHSLFGSSILQRLPLNLRSGPQMPYSIPHRMEAKCHITTLSALLPRPAESPPLKRLPHTVVEICLRAALLSGLSRQYFLSLLLPS